MAFEILLLFIMIVLLESFCLYHLTPCPGMTE